MPQVILPKPVENNDNKQLTVLELQEQQVDVLSVDETFQESEDDYEDDSGYENAVVVNDEAHVPHFGSVSVLNSNDVHFGNKTVYKGPVTIKQFVYPNQSCDPDAGNGGTNKITAAPSDVVENGGIPNGDGAVEENKPQGRDPETFTNKIGKGMEWLKTLPFRKPKETMLFLFSLVISFIVISSLLLWTNTAKVIKINENDIEENDGGPVDYSPDAGDSPIGKYRLVSRFSWLAQPAAGEVWNLTLPVSLVIVHHTATTSCASQAQCVLQTRYIQTFHIESRNWSDIAYNFLIGGDGAVYEGRSWDKVGSHTYGANVYSLGIAFIGTYNTEPPSAKMLITFNKLMNDGVKKSYLTDDYKIKGARQFSGTESPGKAFFELIRKWKHFSEV